MTAASKRLGGMPDLGSHRLRMTVLAVAVIIFAFILPLFYDSGSAFIEDATTALIYVVMALGLNIVVGFAGLLDLGYVAFFAIGAYTIGWFASGFFTDQDIHIGVAAQLKNIPGIHINYLLIVPSPRYSRRAWARCSVRRHCACAATTSRS